MREGRVRDGGNTFNVIYLIDRIGSHREFSGLSLHLMQNTWSLLYWATLKHWAEFESSINPRLAEIHHSEPTTSNNLFAIIWVNCIFSTLCKLFFIFFCSPEEPIKAEHDQNLDDKKRLNSPWNIINHQDIGCSYSELLNLKTTSR